MKKIRVACESLQMDDRYEIRGKIGQGGIGAVYAGYDKNLNREVAIKRIVPESTTDLEREASSQIAHEAAALSKLQHPNIVTVYDVGVDNDGPFVVMELLHGKTIDEVVTKATLTWQDFREFAMQTHEALIAAQDMNLVHRDLKPTNVMLNWLPSGKFQVKIVDFGLAKFSAKPSLQTIDQKDSIFGSIFFMAPEQFERTELDARTDMYSIGCVFYYALTGTHPFNGETGPQVMLSHLDHRIFPLHEVRPDLPRWASDWVMWHVNRMPEHRPTNAREALTFFLQNEKNSPAQSADELMAFSQHQANAVAFANQSPPNPLTSSLQITAPQPIRPPAEFGKNSVHEDSQGLLKTGEFATPASASVPLVEIAPQNVSSSDPPSPPSPESAPQANPEPTAKARPRLIIPSSKPADLLQGTSETTAHPSPASSPSQPTIVSAPVVATQPIIQETRATAPAPMMRAAKKPDPSSSLKSPAIARPVATSAMIPGAPATSLMKPSTNAPITHKLATATAKKADVAKDEAAAQAAAAYMGKKNSGNNTNKVVIAIALGLVVIVAALLLINKISGNKEDKRYNELMELTKDVMIRELPIKKADLDILLSNAISLGDVKGRETIYKALYIATAEDGTDIDAILSDFATNTAMSEDIRVNILSRVIGGRKSPKSVTPLLTFIKSNPSSESAVAALGAIRSQVTDQNFAELMNVMLFTTNNNIRKSCEEAITALIGKSTDKQHLGGIISSAYLTATSTENKQVLLRVLGSTGSEKAKEVILSQFDGDDKIMQMAAADACRNWPDDKFLPDFIALLERDLDAQIRGRIFQSCTTFLMNTSEERDEKATEKLWTELAAKANTPDFQQAIIRSLVKMPANWSYALVKSFADTAEDDDVIDLAEKAMGNIEPKLKTTAPTDSK